MRNFVGYGLLLLCCTTTVVYAAATRWNSLSPEQQAALAPLAQEWDNVPETEQQHFLKTAKGYAQLNAEEKKRYHNNLPIWSKLSNEQREIARSRHRAFENIPEKDRGEAKRSAKEYLEKKNQQAAP